MGHWRYAAVSTEDSLRALVEAGKAAPSASVQRRLARQADAALLAGGPALAEIVLSLSPEDEGMVERVA